MKRWLFAVVGIVLLAAAGLAAFGLYRKQQGHDIRIQARLPEPVAAAPAAPAPQAPVMIENLPEPELELMGEPEPVLDMDDVETPAFMRPGRLLT